MYYYLIFWHSIENLSRVCIDCLMCNNVINEITDIINKIFKFLGYNLSFFLLMMDCSYLMFQLLTVAVTGFHQAMKLTG